MTSHTFMRHVHRPRKTAENIAAAVAGLLAVVLLVVGFTHPTKKPSQVGGAYRSSGAFSYRTNVIKPVSIYPTGVAHAGQPLFLEDFKTLQLGFKYRFASRLHHDVHGTIGLDAVMSSADTNWHRAFQLARTTSFAGDIASVDGRLDLRAMSSLCSTSRRRRARSARTTRSSFSRSCGCEGRSDARSSTRRSRRRCRST